MNVILLAAAIAATAPMPTVSGPVTSPGMMYPNPPVSIVPTAVKVEDFQYITEEYFLSGTAAGAWGLAGATLVHFASIDEETMGEALTFCWQNAAAKAEAKKKGRTGGTGRKGGTGRTVKKRKKR